MSQNQNPLTSGAIYKPMMKFMLPVMFATFLQALYGAVDLLVIGRFVSTDPVVIQNATAAVGTGSMIMVLITYIISGLTMGVTVTLGKYIGANNKEGATRTVSSAVVIFAIFSIVLTVIMELGAPLFAQWMNVPDVNLTVQYLRICSAGLIFITAYNAISGLFRGIGNSKLPLIFVLIASIVNVILDLVLVCFFDMGVAGVAIATITAQAVSVVLSLIIMKKATLPFEISFKKIRFYAEETKLILGTGIPLAAQDFLTNISFVVINSVANHLGSDPTAWAAIASGYSVDNKLTTFMMILPVAFLQSMSVFTAQNMGAKKPERIRKGFRYMVFTTLGAGVLLSALCFFGGEMLASIFTNDAESIMYAAQYLKGFAADMLVGCLVLMMLGYFNGSGHSTFVMIQGLFSAFCIRIPVVLVLSKMADVTLVHLGLGCAAASYSSLIICTVFYIICRHKENSKSEKQNARNRREDTEHD